MDKKHYVFGPTDVIDVDLLLEHAVRGATPVLEHSGAVTAKSVHEKALSAARFRLMVNEGPVRGAVLNGVKEGKLVVRLPNGDVFDAVGQVSGPAGMRQRHEGSRLSTLKLEEDVLLAPSGADCVADWLHVDAPVTPDLLLTLEKAAARKQVPVVLIQEAIDAGKIDTATSDGWRGVAPNERFERWRPDQGGEELATDWPAAAELAATRDCLSLDLNTRDPEGVGKLMAAAQPFSAMTLTQTLKLRLQATLTQAGQVFFSVDGAKHSDPLKPLETAQRILRAAEREGVDLNATLKLDLGDAPANVPPERFAQAHKQGGAHVSVAARFGAPRPAAPRPAAEQAHE